MPAPPAEPSVTPPPGVPLHALFDSVVMLTQSDWRAEPRSNRYHFAKRFAQRLPTLFVQPDGPADAPTDEPTDLEGLRLVHCAWWDTAEDAALAHRPRFRNVSGAPDPRARPTPAQSLKAKLQAMGVRRPLFWLLNLNYLALLEAWPEAPRVFHATEDYTLSEGSGRFFDDAHRTFVLKALQACDGLVAVSEAVRLNYVRAARFEGVAATLPNGCDYSFWSESEAWRGPDPSPPGWLDRLRGLPGQAAIRVLYQGGVNRRLDLPLLTALAKSQPGWRFDFCGAVHFGDEADAGCWRALTARPNVTSHGQLAAEGVAALARQASVGIIPYRPSPLIEVSLPLKAYEYLACGLPVVSTPIPALAQDRALFTFAETAEAYADAIRRLAPSRADADAVACRREAARRMDYDRRFKELQPILADAARRARSRGASPSTRPADRIWPLSGLEIQGAWAAAGARLSVDGAEARLRTPDDPWDFAAILRLSLSPGEAGGPMRLRVRVARVIGEVLLSLYDEASGEAHHEVVLAEAEGQADYDLAVDEASEALLLWRNGAGPGGATLSILAIEAWFGPVDTRDGELFRCAV